MAQYLMQKTREHTSKRRIRSATKHQVIEANVPTPPGGRVKQRQAGTAIGGTCCGSDPADAVASVPAARCSEDNTIASTTGTSGTTVSSELRLP